MILVFFIKFKLTFFTFCRTFMKISKFIFYSWTAGTLKFKYFSRFKKNLSFLIFFKSFIFSPLFYFYNFANFTLPTFFFKLIIKFFSPTPITNLHRHKNLSNINVLNFYISNKINIFTLCHHFLQLALHRSKFLPHNSGLLLNFEKDLDR